MAQSDEAPTDQGAIETPGDGTAIGSNPNPATSPGSATRQQTFPLIFWVPIILIFIFMLWTNSSAQRKERKKREEMLSTLRRHDRVQTIGGIIGSVVEVKDNEVVLKVDETNNVKLRFAKSSIQQVISEGPTTNEAGSTGGTTGAGS